MLVDLLTRKSRLGILMYLSESMKHAGIISRGESLQILNNDLRKAALEKHAGELAKASAEDR
jgi:hypothetical protein